MTDKAPNGEQAAAPAARKPEESLAWLDSSISEFFGSLEECAGHVDAGQLERELLEAKLNAFMLRLVSLAQEGQQQQAVAAGAAAGQ